MAANVTGALCLLLGAAILQGCAGDHNVFEPVIVDKKSAGEFNLKELTSDEGEKAFQLLCKAGKPRRKVEHQLLFVVPHAPDGVALDEATKFTEDLQSLKDAVASEFYQRLAFHTDHSTHFPFLEIADDSTTKDAVADFKARSLAMNPGWAGISIPNLVAADHYVVVLVRSPQSKPEWVISVVSPESYFAQPQTAKHSKKSKKSNDADAQPSPPNGMREAVPIELLAIASQYVLVVSHAERGNWAKIADRRHHGKLDGSISGDVPKGKIMKQSDLIKHRTEIMADYLVANTSVKESTTDDGQVFAFTLSLNTEPLCRLGRPAGSLASK